MTTEPRPQQAASFPADSDTGVKKPLPLIVKVLIGLAVIVGVFVIIVAMQPSEFHIERSAKMKAPPEEIFAQVNDFHKWDVWSPWVKVDPKAKTTFEGPDSGEGAIFRWAGNAEIGEGSMKILESKPPERVHIQLHFLKPFEDTALTDFTLKPEGELTNVTWSMDGKHNFISKACCLLIMDMDKMIGDKYEEGLASIKAIVEAPEGSQQPAENPQPSTEEDKSKNNTPAKEESPAKDESKAKDQ